jgi:hypothetical protein
MTAHPDYEKQLKADLQAICEEDMSSNGLTISQVISVLCNLKDDYVSTMEPKNET